MGLSKQEESEARMVERHAIEALVDTPSETLGVELKSWLDTTKVEHRAKLVRTLLALRNYNGGFLLIGFDDETGRRLPNPPADPRSDYHSDMLHGLISTYASDPFGIEVACVERDGISYPVVQVPAGVQVPVAIKKELKDSEGKVLLRRCDVMFRTLGANSIVSTAPAQPGDWRQIMDICFGNREADLGSFVRRHLLSGGLPEMLAEVGAWMRRVDRPGLEETCREFASSCEARASKRDDLRALPALPEGFGWMEVAVVLDPPATGFVSDQVFQDRLMQSNPRYSNGFWIDTRGFPNQGDRPVVVDGGWETLVDISGTWVVREFTRLEPSGRFYLKRPLSEDSAAPERGAKPGTIMDVASTVSAVAEVMATVIAFSKAVGADPDGGRAGFLFRYHGLKNRRLVSMFGVGPLRSLGHRSEADVWERFIEMPVETVPINLGSFVFALVRELFASFNGYTVAPGTVDAYVKATVERRVMY